MNTFNFKKSQLAASVSLIIAASTLNTAIAAEADTAACLLYTSDAADE